MSALDFALDAASRGFRIVPLPPGSKRPALSDWPNRATSDPAQIRAWFDAAPESNYGLAMGDGLLAIDVDVKGVDGKTSLLDLTRDVGGLPKTLVHATPSGGMHAIYRVPPGTVIPNAVGIVPGVDLRSDGGQIVGPGSRTDAGTYTVLQDAPIADLPAGWVEKLSGERRSYSSASFEPRELLTDGRKDWLLRRVWQLRRTGLGEAAIVAALDAEAPERIADAHLYRWEIRRLARNVVRRDPGDEEPMPPLTGDDLREFRRLRMTDEQAVEDVRAERSEAFRVLGLSTIMSEPAPPSLVGAWLPQGALAVIYGKPNSGKSLVALDWALSVANGVPWLDDIDVAQGYVLYVLGEGRLQERAAAWRYGHWRSGEGDPMSGVGVHRDGFKFTQENVVAGLLEHVRMTSPALVVFDTLARTIGDDENASAAMDRVVDASYAIRSASPLSTVLVIAHPAKNGEGIRGHSSLEGAADIIVKAVGQPSVPKYPGGTGSASEYAAGEATGGALTLSSEKNKDGGRVAPLDLCLRSDTHSVYLDHDRQKIRQRATAPPSRQGGAGRQQDGLRGWEP